jgi:phosphate transport system permease protein
LAVASAISAGVILVVVAFVWRESSSMLGRSGLQQFFAGDGWHPTEGHYDLSPMIYATLAMGFGTLSLAVPLGLGSAIFGRFYAPAELVVPYRRLLGIMAGVPSVVYGLWGLTVVVPLIVHLEPPGASLLAGTIVLAMMVLPTIALTCEAALVQVPQSYLHGAAAVGLGKKSTIFHVALPAAKRGLIAGVLLAGARAVGETMAVIMVAGNVVQMPTSLFDPVRVLTANIAMEMAYAVGDHRASLFVTGLILIAMVAALALLALYVRRGRDFG